MKTIAIGDIHGRDSWKQIVLAENDVNQFVFIGDYFDSFNISTLDQLENFRDIIAFKKANMDKVILLFGNHDFHYLRYVSERYSGFSATRKTAVENDLHEATRENMIQMCYVSGNVMFSHAGVTKTWCKENDIDTIHPEQSINDLFRQRPLAFKHTKGPLWNAYGDETCQTPIWVRPASLRADKLDFYIQVVGHTEQPKMTFSDDGIVLIDTLGTSGEYLEITGEKFFIKRLTNEIP